LRRWCTRRPACRSANPRHHREYARPAGPFSGGSLVTGSVLSAIRRARTTRKRLQTGGC
jgi:hypothetical protein